VVLSPKTQECIFCRSPSGDAKGVEHTVPESLGNVRHVLPLGVVCDRCNNYFSRKVEAPVLSHQSFRNLRAWIGIPNKAGKRPSFAAIQLSSGIEVSVRILDDGELHVTAERGAELNRMLTHASEDEATGLHGFGLNMEFNPPQKEMSRLLAKIALERAYNDFINASPSVPHFIFDPYFDNIRRWARLGNNFAHWPFHQRTIYPQETFMRHPQTNAWVMAGIGQGLFHTNAPETYFSICFYGVEFIINLGGPNIEGFERWLEEHNFESPFLAHSGLRLVASSHKDQHTYFLDRCQPLRRQHNASVRGQGAKR
jgi:hypothetical protein